MRKTTWQVLQRDDVAERLLFSQSDWVALAIHHWIDNQRLSIVSPDQRSVALKVSIARSALVLAVFPYGSGSVIGATESRIATPRCARLAMTSGGSGNAPRGRDVCH